MICLGVVACGDNAQPPGTVTVTVSGLAGHGLVLQNHGGDDLAIDADGVFAFSRPVAFGASYAVTVAAQPTSPTQTCVVTSGAGTIESRVAVNVVVTCTTGAFAVGGTVAGLTGAGLVLENGGGDALAITADGSFAFPTPLASGSAFAVTVKAQPTGPSQTCTVSSATGTVVASAVTTVVVDCTVDRFAIGGTIAGLAGGTVVLQDNLGDNLPVSADGTFTFATPVASGEAYRVTVLTQPTSPSQTCVVAGDRGVVGGAAVTDVIVTCTTNAYTIGGTVVGLAGSGLVLQDNAGDDLAITVDGAFTFAAPVASGDGFEVTVKSQPTSPWQSCTVSGDTGTVVSANVTSVTVNCTTDRHAIGGVVAGLDGTGLQLSLDGGAPLAIGADGSYAFPTLVASGASYTVAVVGEPHSRWQTCTLAGASGVVAGSDITDVGVRCTTNTYAIGGTVTGVAGTGVTLQDNGGDDLAVAADGTFTFATRVASGEPYDVTISAQPTSPWQTCAVTSGAGTVAGGDLTSVVVTCTTNTYAVRGTIAGLAGPVVVQNNLGDNLTLTADGAFTFDTALPSGTGYAVTVLTQPGSPSQTCTVSSGSGTITSADVTTVGIACVTNTFSIGGTVTGLAGTGLVLRDNGGDDLAIGGDGGFQFATPIASGQGFAVTVLAQPSAPAQTCVVTGDTGTVGGADVTSVVVNCTTNTYTVGGALSGLGGATGLVLQNAGGDDLALSADGTFAFATPVASGASYDITVKTQPTSPWETCTVTGGTGTVASADVATVVVSCTVNVYDVAVSVTGLSGSGLVLQNRGGDDLSVAADGTYAFVTQVASGSTYDVTVVSQPTSPWQTCSVAASTGTMGDGVTVAVSCVANAYSIGGTVSGVAGTGLVLQNRGGDDLSISSDGAFTFTTPVASGQPYDVTIKTQPSGQSCAVLGASGTVGGAAVTSVHLLCNLTFTSCGALGHLGPSSALCSSAYAGTALAGKVTVSGAGIQHWTVPFTGTYRIEAFGAQGASAAGLAGGRGARIRGDFTLSAGTVLRIVVGQQGLGQASGSNGGGGGGSFVVNGATILVVAGGGGGTRVAATVNGFDASTGTSGVNGNISSNGIGGAVVAGGTGGGGGSFSSSWGCGGGGYLGNGASDGFGGTGGASFVNGAVGGSGGACGFAANGGFGGGGSGVGCAGGGGGGGYSGGGGAFIAGGGGSFNAGTNGFAASGARTGAGQVTISPIP